MKHDSRPRIDNAQPDDRCATRLQTFRPARSQPRSVYVHIPFCRHRCGYCNFSLVAGRDYLIERFLSALEIEIGWLDQTYPIDTLFLGGGTPSHLSPAQLHRLSHILDSRFILQRSSEVTAECNPNDLDERQMAALAKLGVNRISLGVQSFDPVKLKTLDREHTIAEIGTAIEVARKHGATISLDLIFAAPDEQLATWQSDLKTAIKLNPDHVSTYELTYEKGTRFWNGLLRGDLHQSDEDLRADMYSMAIRLLNQAGLKQYEVSSFAQTGNRCMHNFRYWTGDSYFAFGPGASRFVDGIRETNHQSTMRYLKLVEQGEPPVADREHLVGAAAARERLAIGLRTIDGVCGTEFEQRSGMSVSSVLGVLEERWIQEDLLICRDDHWRLTNRGILLCDRIAAEILAR